MAEEKKKQEEKDKKKDVKGKKGKMADRLLRRRKEPKKGIHDATSKDPYEALRFVLMTEKSVRMIEAQNKLVFIVNRKYGKKEIKAAAESAFNSRVADVTTMIDQSGRKKAFVKFEKPGEAGEIAIRLGII